MQRCELESSQSYELHLAVTVAGAAMALLGKELLENLRESREKVRPAKAFCEQTELRQPDWRSLCAKSKSRSREVSGRATCYAGDILEKLRLRTRNLNGEAKLTLSKAEINSKCICARSKQSKEAVSEL
jgi:hypothetical protein